MKVGFSTKVQVWTCACWWDSKFLFCNYSQKEKCFPFAASPPTCPVLDKGVIQLSWRDGGLGDNRSFMDKKKETGVWGEREKEREEEVRVLAQLDLVRNKPCAMEMQALVWLFLPPVKLGGSNREMIILSSKCRGCLGTGTPTHTG